LGWFGQRPELSQATGMALVRCIMGKFLGVVCHCFPRNKYVLRKNKDIVSVSVILSSDYVALKV